MRSTNHHHHHRANAQSPPTTTTSLLYHHHLPPLLYSTLFYSTLLYCTLLSSTLLYSTLLYSTLLYSPLLSSTLLYSSLLSSTLLYSPLLSSPLLSSTLLYSTLLYSTLLYSALLYSTLLYSTLLFSSLFYSTLLSSPLLSSPLLSSTLLYSTLLYSPLLFDAGDKAQRGPDEWYEPQFVTRYELLWRAEGGRAWHSLGNFGGNSDGTSEVSHSFSTVRGGLHARYLRLVPLECSEGGGAVRVGVYGRALGAERTRGGSAEVEGSDQLVMYTLTTAPDGRSTHYAPDGRGPASGSRDWYDANKKKSTRMRRKLQAKTEMRPGSRRPYFSELF